MKKKKKGKQKKQYSPFEKKSVLEEMKILLVIIPVTAAMLLLIILGAYVYELYPLFCEKVGQIVEIMFCLFGLFILIFVIVYVILAVVEGIRFGFGSSSSSKSFRQLEYEETAKHENELKKIFFPDQYSDKEDDC